MAEQPPTPTQESGDNASFHSHDTTNGSPSNNAQSETLPVPPPSRGGMRSPSQKFASLRAAFEKDGGVPPGPDGLKRRLPSSERGSTTPAMGTRERNQEQEAELTKMREEAAEEKQLRVAYEERVTGLEDEIEALRAQLATRDAAVEEHFTALQSEARQHKQENSTLHKQLTDLKRNISTSTRTGAAQTADSTLEQEFGTLHHETQNWVVNHFRRAKNELTPLELCERLENMGEKKHLDRLKSIYDRFVPANKLAIYQATVACYLMEIFEDRFLFGMPPDQEWRKRIRKAAESLPTVLPPASYNRWRAATFDAIRQSPLMEESVESATNGIAEMVCIKLRAMADLDDTDGKMLGSLKTIIRRAVSLAHLVRIQQASYDFALPGPGTKLDNTLMENMSPDESESEMELTVYCATFPAVIKIGDDRGENNELQNVLTRAKVLCSSESA